MGYIPTKPDFIPIPFAQKGERNSIQESPAANGDPDATWEQGFPTITRISKNAGGKPPLGKDFQGIFYTLSNHIFWLQSGSVYPWDANFNYLAGSHCLGADGVEYRALNPSGPDMPGGSGYVGAKNPTIETAYWKDCRLADHADEADHADKASLADSANKLTTSRAVKIKDYEGNTIASENFNGTSELVLQLAEEFKAKVEYAKDALNAQNAQNAEEAEHAKTAGSVEGLTEISDQLKNLTKQIDNSQIHTGGSTINLYVDASNTNANDSNEGTKSNQPLKTLKQAILNSRRYNGNTNIYVDNMKSDTGATTFVGDNISITFRNDISFNPVFTFIDCRVVLNINSNTINGTSSGGFNFYHSYIDIKGGGTLKVKERFRVLYNTYLCLSGATDITTLENLHVGYNSSLIIKANSYFNCQKATVEEFGACILNENSQLNCKGVGTDGKLSITRNSFISTDGSDITCGCMGVSAWSYAYLSSTSSGTLASLNITCTATSDAHPHYCALEIRMAGFFIDGNATINIRYSGKCTEKFQGKAYNEYTQYGIWVRQHAIFLAESTYAEGSITIDFSPTGSDSYFKDYTYCVSQNSAMVFSSDTTFEGTLKPNTNKKYYVGYNALIRMNGAGNALQGVLAGKIDANGSNYYG